MKKIIILTTCVAILMGFSIYIKFNPFLSEAFSKEDILTSKTEKDSSYEIKHKNSAWFRAMSY